MAAVLRILASPVALATLFVACQDQTISRPPPADPRIDDGDDAAVSEPSADAAPRREAGACPEPRVLAPSDLGPGFLAPQKVTLVRAVDGDTAHFRFPGSGEQTCRFLWVDTEESTGDERSDFGVQTKTVVAAYLQAAKDIVVAVHEAPGKAGQPELDQYNRWLSLVFVDGDLFQTRLVREGLTPYYTQFGCAPEPVHLTLLHAEAEANGDAKGIWKPDHPIDYESSVNRWMGRQPWCRLNPFRQPYCN